MIQIIFQILFGKYLWALRKLRYCRTTKKIAYIGFDVTPFAGALFLIEPSNEGSGIEMHKNGRQIVIKSDCLNLPFRDKSVDYVIVSNTLDFCAKPQLFIDEISRIGSAGYFEAGSALLERLYPHPSRISETANVHGDLWITLKEKSVPDDLLNKIELFSTQKQWRTLLERLPHIFFFTYYWKNSPTVILDAPSNIDEAEHIWELPVRPNVGVSGIKHTIFQYLSTMLVKKRSKEELFGLLICRNCGSQL